MNSRKTAICSCFFGVVLLLMNVGCNGRSIGRFKQLEKAACDSYCSSNLYEAETGLIRFRDEIVEYLDAGVPGINYDRSLGLVDARLFGVLSSNQHPLEAEKCLANSVEAFNREIRMHSGESGGATRSNVLWHIERLDSQLNVRWKRRESRESPIIVP